jgi:phosphatidylglycerol:prolipoprotein diacylglycerol transferase
MLHHPDIDPVIIRVGPLAVRWYGLMYLVGFAAGWLLGRHRAKPGSGWTPLMVDDMITWCVLGLVVGARLGYVLFYDLPVFLADPLSIFEVWHGGMSFHGGAVGVGLVLWIFARKHGMRFFQVTDFLVPLCPPGLFAGRMGNFINGELWGKPTDLPWGMVFSDPRAGMIARHPSQLYEGLLEGVVLFTVMWLFTSKARPVKAASGLFVLLYGCFRFLIEFVRQPDEQLGYLAWNWLTMGQILSLPMIAIGAYWLYTAYAKEQPVPAGR